MNLMYLDDCQQTFVTHLKDLSGKAGIEIRHIALDLFRAKNHIIALLERHYRIQTASLTILVITNDHRRIPGKVPPSVIKMTQRVDAAVGEIRECLDKVDEEYQKRARKLTVEVRAYTELPNIHGFGVREKGRNVASYYSFCRWKPQGNELDWGDGRYREILGQPEDEDGSARDLIEIFDGAFAHLRSNSERQFQKTIGIKRIIRTSELR